MRNKPGKIMHQIWNLLSLEVLGDTQVGLSTGTR